MDHMANLLSRFQPCTQLLNQTFESLQVSTKLVCSMHLLICQKFQIHGNNSFTPPPYTPPCNAPSRIQTCMTHLLHVPSLLHLKFLQYYYKGYSKCKTNTLLYDHPSTINESNYQNTESKYNIITLPHHIAYSLWHFIFHQTFLQNIDQVSSIPLHLANAYLFLSLLVCILLFSLFIQMGLRLLINQAFLSNELGCPNHLLSQHEFDFYIRKLKINISIN